MGEKAYFGIMIPKEYGGLGGRVFEYCLITEELSGTSPLHPSAATRWQASLTAG